MNRESRRSKEAVPASTNARRRILLTLAECYCASARDLTEYLYDTSGVSAVRNTNKLLKALEREHLVNAVAYAPSDYAHGALPKAWGLSANGIRHAADGFPETDPLEFKRTRSLLTLEHDVKCARTQLRLAKYCDEHGLDFYCQKTDLARSVDPDRLFAIDNPATGRKAYFFYEAENRKKNFEDLFAKCEPYQKLYGSERCFHEWGEFTEFRVVLQFASEERHDNFLAYLAGVCTCIYRRGKITHTCRPHAPLRRKTFWFTTDARIAGDPGGPIFRTPEDYAVRAYSFLDA